MSETDENKLKEKLDNSRINLEDNPILNIGGDASEEHVSDSVLKDLRDPRLDRSYYMMIAERSCRTMRIG